MEPNKIRLALAQINTTVGALDLNAELIIENIQKSRENAVDLIVFPELSITGYPPEDLLFKKQFVNKNIEKLHQIASHTRNIAAIVGFADKTDKLYNAAAILYNGEICGVYHKIFLPNYGVFDEKRYFSSGETLLSMEYRGIKIGLNICEDIWASHGLVESQVYEAGAEIIINISASPFNVGKVKERERILTAHAISNRVIFVYTNLVGGQDELVFDGQSFILDELGEIIELGKPFREDLIISDISVQQLRGTRSEDSGYQDRFQYFKGTYKHDSITLKAEETGEIKPPLPGRKERRLSHIGEIYQALVLGTRDYIQKNGFQKVVLGLSGGIDSALTAVIAADALGNDNVIGIAMPSQYTSDASKIDAQQLAENLGMKLYTIPIAPLFDAYKIALKPVFGSLAEDVTEENIQARIRGNILMAFSNKFGWLTLSTGNKSEISVGYCTLYGDMVGGYSVIKDVPKTVVYQLARYRNSFGNGGVIPDNIIEKTPSAELKPDQKDEDSLPAYAILDPILEAYIEKDMDISEIVGLGFPEDVIKDVIRMVDYNEHKRRQGAPGIKITPRAFGKDRRMPLTNRFRGY
ncbi:NAD+ synthase [candidate division KSB1 bacterium]|nr:NAD+ synthase [candidate division KSB1 bacterium]